MVSNALKTAPTASAESAHVDTFTRDNLPPPEQMPEFRFTLPELHYPARLNAVGELLDRHVAEGRGERVCLREPGRPPWTYAYLQEQVNRIANVLTAELGLKPGNRVLLRSPNNAMLVASYLAVLKAGGVVVATMPLLRAKELSYIVRKARIGLALCDERLAEELERTLELEPMLERAVYFGTLKPDGLEARMAAAKPAFDAVDTAADDVCLIGFTSGTTGEPKGTMHFHRDLLATCDSYGRHILEARADDIFTGTPPIGFTFGLGGVVLFPMRVGASTVLFERPTPDDILAVLRNERPTVLFTAPTAYRALIPRLAPEDTSSLRVCVSAGEALPLATWQAWQEATGIKIQDGIGATEMLHIFISARLNEIRPGATGKAVPGYEACVVDDSGAALPPGSIGRLAVRGPTGCRYLADERQRRYVENGWNVTGDSYLMDAEGYFWYQARSDDMIISAGYNIAGPEVENALLTHPAVQECGVIGVPHPERGMIVKAFVVLRPPYAPMSELVRELQDHVKREIAPYKYPRAIDFVASLPRTENAKLKRGELRAMDAASERSPKT